MLADETLEFQATHISPMSPLYLACISPVSRLYLAYTSPIPPISPLYLPHISPTSPQAASVAARLEWMSQLEAHLGMQVTGRNSP